MMLCATGFGLYGFRISQSLSLRALVGRYLKGTPNLIINPFDRIYVWEVK